MLKDDSVYIGHMLDTARKARSLIELLWKAIVGMRTKIVHDYLDVDEDIVWDTLTQELPELMRILEGMVNE